MQVLESPAIFVGTDDVTALYIGGDLVWHFATSGSIGFIVPDAGDYED